MKAPLRENLIVVVSVTLPIVVVAAFAAAMLVPAWLVGSPAYDVVLAHELRNATSGIQIRVVDERVRARVVRAGRFGYSYPPRVYVFDTETGEMTQVAIQMPSDASTLEVGDELPVSGLEDAHIDPSFVSPDGWRYELPREVRSSLGFSDLFGGGGGRRTEARLVKDGAIVQLPTEQRTYGATHYLFVGWIVE